MKIIVMAFFSIMLISKSGYSLEPKNAKPFTTHEQLAFDKQSNKGPDLELVSKIRNAINDDKSLSKNAKNIQILIIKKEIVLKGPVNSGADKNRLLSIANKLKTDHIIRNQIEISNSIDLSTP